MALLFESAGQLHDISFCNPSSFESASADDLIVVVSKSLVRLKPQTGEILQTINVSSHMADVISAVPLPDHAILAALADSSLLYIPHNAATTSNLVPVRWPIQPLSLRILTSSSVLITCKHNILCELHLSNLTNTPEPPKTTKAKTKAKKTESDAIATCIVGRNSHVLMTLGLDSSGSASSSSSSPSSSSSRSLYVTIWKRSTISTAQSSSTAVAATNLRWYEPENSTLVRLTAIAETDQRVLTMCTDGISKYSCIVLVEDKGANTTTVSKTSGRGRGKKAETIDPISSANTKQVSNQWIKLSDAGEVIFTRNLENKPLRANASENFLFLLSPNSVDLWDISYGVLCFTVETSLPLSQSISLPQSLNTIFIPQTVVAVPTSTDGSSFNVIIGSTSSTASKTTSLLHVAIQNTKFKNAGTLLQAFGGLSQPFDQINSSGIGSISSVEEEVDKFEDKYKILGGLPGRDKRELSRAQKRLEDDEEKAAAAANNDVRDSRKNKKYNDKRKLVLSDVPPACCVSFMQRMDSALKMNQEALIEDNQNASKSKSKSRSKTKSPASSSSSSSSSTTLDIPVQILPSDWDALRTVLHTGTISISKHPLLIPIAAKMGRADILQTISLYCPDLTEIETVNLLNHVALIPTTTMNILRVDKQSGVVVWGKEKVSDDDNGGDVSTGSKKRKAVTAVSPPSHFYLLTAIIRSILNRSEGYSSILLSEAVRRGMDVFSASILLRILAFMLKDIFIIDSISDSMNGYFVESGLLGENMITQAITWAESIIDAHFPSLALALTASLDARKTSISADTNANTKTKSIHIKDIQDNARQASSRISIVKTIDAVANIDEATHEIENLMGTWEQVLVTHQNASRCDKKGRTINSAPIGMYSQETLYL